MLGDMLSARAAAEKPPLSTTFTKVDMLVMRSMEPLTRSFGQAHGYVQSSPPYQVVSGDHFCSHFRKRERRRHLTCADAGENRATNPLPDVPVVIGPAHQGPKRIAGHGRQAHARKALIGVENRGQGDAFDDDGAIIGWSWLNRAFDRN